LRMRVRARSLRWVISTPSMKIWPPEALSTRRSGRAE
jgi:hypothetical protein